MNPSLSFSDLLYTANAYKQAQTQALSLKYQIMKLNLQKSFYLQQAAYKSLISILPENKPMKMAEPLLYRENPISMTLPTILANNISPTSSSSEPSLSSCENPTSVPVPGILHKSIFKHKDNIRTSMEDERERGKRISAPKRTPSKAKHLWINYGRKIIEYAITHTDGETQTRIKQLIGKLSSKKDFATILGHKSSDNESDKAFKQLFGQMALYFIKHKAETAFQGSKYRDQMITQKNIVKVWVEKLTGEK